MPKTIALYGADGRRELSPEQLHVAEHLALPQKGGKTLEQLAAEVGVSSRTIHRWRLDPDFARHVRELTLQRISDRLPEVLDVVTDEALQGSGKHAELLLKAAGMLREHHVLQPAAPEDSRSPQALEDSIAELERKLAAAEGSEEE